MGWKIIIFIFVNDDKYVVEIDCLCSLIKNSDSRQKRQHFSGFYKIDVWGLMYLILDSKFYLLVVLFWLHIPSQLKFDLQVSVQQTNLSSENTIDPNKKVVTNQYTFVVIIFHNVCLSNKGHQYQFEFWSNSALGYQWIINIKQ